MRLINQKMTKLLDAVRQRMPDNRRATTHQSAIGFCLLLAAVTVLFVAQGLFAQVAGTGTIQGTVFDATGRVVAGAEVTAQEVSTGRISTQPTSSAGVYALSALPPGEYTVDIKAQGFAPVRQEHITVDALTVVGLNITMKVGSEVEQIVVTAAPPQLDTENGTLDTTIPNDTYSALPVSMGGSPKSPLGFLSFVPGSASGDFGVQEINGGPGNTAFLYQNGLPVTTSEMQGDARNVNGSTSTEVVDQFQVVTSGIPAYYAGQGVTNLVLKSGTNAFHGDVYENVRNTVFDAAGFFSNAVPVEHQNEYGFSVGGPMLKNKLFFFMNLDRFKFVSGNQPQQYSLPTAAEREGDFSALLDLTDANGNPAPQVIYDPSTTSCNAATGVCTRKAFPGNKITGGLSNVAKLAEALLPPTANGNLQNNYSNALPNGEKQNTYFGKVDYNISTQHHLYAMFQTGKVSPSSYYNGGAQLPLPFTSGRFGFQIITIAQVGETWTIKPNLLNLFGAQFNEFKTPFVNPTSGGGWATKLDITGLPLGDPQDIFPQFGFSGANSPTSWALNGYSQSFSESAPNYVYQDNLQWVKGKHSFTFGGQFIENQENTNIPNSDSGFNFSNSETAGFLPGKGTLDTTSGNAYASYLLGLVDNSSATDTSVQETGARYQNIAVYAQDDWKLSPKLTVNIGLRYIIPKPFVEQHDRNSWFNPNLANPEVGIDGALEFAGSSAASSCHCRSEVKTHYMTFDPRIGFAYTVDPKSVVRGAYTVNHYNGGMLGGNANSQGASLLGYAANPSFNSPDSGITSAFKLDSGFPAYQHPPFYSATLNTGYNTTTGNTGGGVTYNRPDTAGLSPYTENWNLTIDRAITPSMTLQVTYAGSGSHHIAVNGGVGKYSNQIDPKYLKLGALLQQPVTPTTLAQAQQIFPEVVLPYPTFVGSIGQALRPFPQYSGVGDPYAQFASESYQALQMSMQRRMTKGLYFLAAYTWSKNINDTGGTINFVYSTPRTAYDLHKEKAIDASNIPQQISLAWVYSLPFGKGHQFANQNGVLDAVVGGWQISSVQQYNAGSPLGTIGGACNVPYAGGCYADYNSTFTGPVRINGRYGAGVSKTNTNTAYIDKGAFQDAAPFTFGTTPRTMAFGLRNPWYLNESATIGKNFNLIETMTLRIQADAFNVFNRTQFGGITTNIDSSAFGTISNQSNSPRNLQFEAYLKF
jgi:hypothetical protein